MIETNNMYYAAFLLNEGCIISNVEKRYDSKLGNTVVFIFTGEDTDHEDELDTGYDLRTASTNLRGYIDALTRVRDIMYGLLNQKNLKGMKHENRRSKRAIVKS